MQGTGINVRDRVVGCYCLLGDTLPLLLSGVTNSQPKIPILNRLASGIAKDTQFGSDGSNTCHGCMQEKGSLHRLWCWVSTTETIFELAL